MLLTHKKWDEANESKYSFNVHQTHTPSPVLCLVFCCCHMHTGIWSFFDMARLSHSALLSAFFFFLCFCPFLHIRSSACLTLSPVWPHLLCMRVYISFSLCCITITIFHIRSAQQTWPHANANAKVRRGEHYMPCIYFCYHICIICMICRNVYDFFSVDFRYFLFICCVHRRSGENLTPPHCTRVYLLLAIWLLFVASEETTDYYYRRQRRCRIVFCISFR